MISLATLCAISGNVPQSHIAVRKPPTPRFIHQYRMMYSGMLQESHGVTSQKNGILHSHLRENLKPYIWLIGCALQRRRNVSPVRYELGFYIPEDGIRHSHRRENLISEIFVSNFCFSSLSCCVKWRTPWCRCRLASRLRSSALRCLKTREISRTRRGALLGTGASLSSTGTICTTGGNCCEKYWSGGGRRGRDARFAPEVWSVWRVASALQREWVR
jgi:hypothetical protein